MSRKQSDPVFPGHGYIGRARIFLGLGNLAHKQIVKGILFLAVEIAYLLFMIEGGINNLYHLITLGGRAQEEVWNEAKGIYEYTGGDMTILFLLYGVATILLRFSSL